MTAEVVFLFRLGGLSLLVLALEWLANRRAHARGIRRRN